jgi:hypothetical protein
MKYQISTFFQQEFYALRAQRSYKNFTNTACVC